MAFGVYQPKWGACILRDLIQLSILLVESCHGRTIDFTSIGSKLKVEVRLIQKVLIVVTRLGKKVKEDIYC